MRIVVTGGAGFVGSALIRYLLSNTNADIINIDKLSDTSNPASLETIGKNTRYFFERVSTASLKDIARVLEKYNPTHVFHLAADTDVVYATTKSSTKIMHLNYMGSYMLVEACHRYLEVKKPKTFRFINVSTDEVYGALGDRGKFTEDCCLCPNNPYASSKAAQDMLMKGLAECFRVPIITVRIPSVYGPYQQEDKLIPYLIRQALESESMPIHGNGRNIRDWIHVDDVSEGMFRIAMIGKIGQIYNLGADSERSNLEVANMVALYMDQMFPSKYLHKQLIKFVADKKQNDYRRALDISKIRSELAWRPSISFEDGIRSTVKWFIDRKFKKEFPKESVG